MNDTEWGDVATWVSSMTTLAAVIAAFVAIHMQRQDFRLAERQRRQGLAAGVSVEVASSPQATATGESLWPFTVLNASAAPIFGRAIRMPRSDGVLAASYLGTIGAGRSLKKAAFSDPGTHTDLGFTDSEGNHWVRRWTGSLVQVPVPPGPIFLSGPQGFDIAEYLDPRPQVEKPAELVEKVEEWAQRTGLLDVRDARKRRDRGLLP